MPTPRPIGPDPRRIARLERNSRLAGLLSATVGGSVAVGWILDIDVLQHVLPNFPVMTANAAFCFVFAGVALYLSTSSRPLRFVREGLAGAVLIVGVVTAVQYVFGVNFGIDELLFTDPEATGPPGRMALATAGCFAVLGTALLALRMERVRAAHAGAVAVTIVSFTALLGYVFGASQLYRIAAHSSMALHTSVTMGLLALGLLAARPHAGLTAVFTNHGAGGLLVRRVLPIAVVVPVIVGWLVLRGHEAGIYDARFAYSITGVSTVILIGLLLWTAAEQSFRLDRERHSAEELVRVLKLEEEAARAVREREAFFRAIADNASDLVLRMDPDGRIAYASPASRVLLRLAPEEMTGKTLGDFTTPDAAKELESVFGSLLNGSPAVLQQPLRTKDGEEKWVEASANPVTDPSTRITIAIIWVLRDVSAHVTALENEREIARKQEELNQLKNEFVGVVAHDLKSPMTVIAGFADMLVSEWEATDDEIRRDALARIRDNTHRLSTMVDDVLQVARIESGELTFQIAPFDLGRLLRSTVDEMCSGQDGRRCELSIPLDLPLALGDEERHWRVLTNLISNALKFSDGPEPIAIEVRLDVKELHVSICDRGHGIRSEDIPKLFQRFSRVQQPEGRRVKGTGLGLYICKSLVEAQGGRIWAESTLGKGSTFHYTVPVASEDQGRVGT